MLPSLSPLLGGLASNTAARRTTQLEMQLGLVPCPGITVCICMDAWGTWSYTKPTWVCLFCVRQCVRAHVGCALCTCWCRHRARHACECTCMSQGGDMAAPQRDLLRITPLQAASFLVDNNLFTQSWAHVELMLSAHVYDKTVDLSELSPTNRWGNWSTRTSHRAAALMPCS